MLGVIDEVIAFAKRIGELNVKPREAQCEIDGLVYTSRKLPTDLGLELWPRVTSLLGAALAKAAVTGDGVGLDASAISRVAERAMRDGLVPLCRDLLSQTIVNKVNGGTEPGRLADHFNEHFAGEYTHLLKVAIFVLAHNLRGPTYGVR